MPCLKSIKLAVYVNRIRLLSTWIFFRNQRQWLREWAVFRLVLGYVHLGCFLLRQPLNSWTSRQLVLLCIRAPDMVHMKKNVLEHPVFLLKSLVLGEERSKSVFTRVALGVSKTNNKI